MARIERQLPRSTSINLERFFGLTEKVAVVTGGSGVLGGAMAKGLAEAGASVAVIGRNYPRTARTAYEVMREGQKTLVVLGDVMEEKSLLKARERVLGHFGKIDILVNAAGGNVKEATIPPVGSFFNTSMKAFGEVMDLNLKGTVLASKVFGEAMLDKPDGEKGGSIINISSMAADRALTRVMGYGVAKAAVENFTKSLSVELATKYGEGFRVNAIAPGFFEGEQNRKLLRNDDSTLTDRGQTIIDHTPVGRFGDSEDLKSTLIYLCSDGARFVNGVVVPVDGGFGRYSGV